MKVYLYKSGITFFSCLLYILSSAGSVFPQEAEIAKYPSRPITFIVSSPAGSSTDLACRLIAKGAEKFLGQPIVFLNKPGGSNTIGVAAITVSKPDGYTIGVTGHPGLFFAPIIEKVPYHPLRDLKEIMQFGCMNIAVFVKGDSPFNSFDDIVAYAQQNPKKLTYGTAGTGTAGHVTMEQIAKKKGVQFTHIPFKGSPETQAALFQRKHILVGTGGFNYSLLESGEIRLILLIAEERSTSYPGTRILKDLGVDIPAPMLLNVAGPKGLPEAIAKKLEEAFAKAMREPAFIQGMKDLRFDIVYRNGRDLTDYVASNYEVFTKILKEMGLAK